MSKQVYEFTFEEVAYALAQQLGMDTSGMSADIRFDKKGICTVKFYKLPESNTTTQKARKD